jgi:MATE family multidrug resistance protein
VSELVVIVTISIFIEETVKTKRGEKKKLVVRNNTMSSIENQPLLFGLDSHSHIANLSSDSIEEFLEHRPIQLRWWLKLVAWESRVLWILSGASIIVYLFNYMLSFATLMFSGHLGSLELAGASIANVGIQGLAYGIMV